MKKVLSVAGSILLSFVWARAAGPSIGQAVSQGRMQVDNLAVTGSVNLTDGSVLKTLDAPGRVFLENGGRAALGAASEAKVLAGRIVLLSGAGTIDAAGGLRVEANGYAVQPDTGAQAHVEYQGTKVVVGAANGRVGVRDKEGALLARVMPGKPLTFEPSGGSASSTVSGILVRQDGKFLVKDELTNVDVRLEGKDLNASLGRRVQATGEARSMALESPQVILVSKLEPLGDEPQPPAKAAAKKSGDPTPAVKAKSGMSRGTKIGIGVLAASGAAIGASLGAISR